MVTQVSPAGRPFKNTVVAVKIGTDAQVRYETQVNSCEFVPSQATLRWSGGTEDAELTDVGAVEYVCNATAVQAWEDPASFINVCEEHAGELAELTYYPLDDVNVGFRTTITLPSPRIGGGAKAYNEWSFSVPCPRPEKLTAAAPAVTP